MSSRCRSFHSHVKSLGMRRVSPPALTWTDGASRGVA